MAKLYVIKDGIKNVGCIESKDGNQVTGTNFYLISFDFKSNEGYIEQKEISRWRLYTQVGELKTKTRYYHFPTFTDCVVKLQHLCYPLEVKIIDSTDVPNINLESKS